MTRTKQRFTPAFALCAVALLANCTSPAQPSSVPSLGAQSARTASAPRTVADLYVITWWRERVLGFAGTGGKPVIQLQGLVNPHGLALDASGNVYVSDAYADLVAAYAPGSPHPFATIQEPSGNHPYHVVVASSGNIWTSNVVSSGGGQLAEFSSNGVLVQTVSCAGISDYSGALAIDTAGDVFVQSGSGQRHYVVEEIAAGQTSCKTLPPKFAGPGGLAVTNSGDLVVGDRQNYDAFTYAAPDFAKVVARTNLGGGNPHGASFPIDLSLTKANSAIWTANYPGPQNYGFTLYRYPHGSSHRLAHIHASYGAGIAVAADY